MKTITEAAADAIMEHCYDGAQALRIAQTVLTVAAQHQPLADLMNAEDEDDREINRILAMSGDELRAELVAEGHDPEALVRQMGRGLDGTLRLAADRQRWREEAASWRRVAEQLEEEKRAIPKVERERIAKIINPDAFVGLGEPDYYGPDFEKAWCSAGQRVAFEKADAILSDLSVNAASDQPPASSGKALTGKAQGAEDAEQRQSAEYQDGFNTANERADERIKELERDYSLLCDELRRRGALDDSPASSGKALTGKAQGAEREGFTAGYAMACANIVNLHGEDTIAENVLAESGITLAEVKALGLTDYDMKPLRALFREIARKRKISKAKATPPASSGQGGR